MTNRTILKAIIREALQMDVSNMSSSEVDKIQAKKDPNVVITDETPGDGKGLSENFDGNDQVSMPAPLFVKLLEYVKGNIDSGDINDVAERIISLSGEGGLTMDDYETIIG